MRCFNVIKNANLIKLLPLKNSQRFIMTKYKFHGQSYMNNNSNNNNDNIVVDTTHFSKGSQKKIEKKIDNVDSMTTMNNTKQNIGDSTSNKMGKTLEKYLKKWNLIIDSEFVEKNKHKIEQIMNDIDNLNKNGGKDPAMTKQEIGRKLGELTTILKGELPKENSSNEKNDPWRSVSTKDIIESDESFPLYIWRILKTFGVVLGIIIILNTIVSFRN